MDDHLEEIHMLRKLHGGELSRNSDFERFDDSRFRRIHHSYRLLIALRAEVARPNCTARLEKGKGDAESIIVQIDSFRYKRRVELAHWEAEFLLDEMGAARFLSDAEEGSWEEEGC